MEHIEFTTPTAAAKWGMVVDAAQSHRFFESIFAGLHRSRMRSVVWDSLWVDFVHVASHLTVAGRQQEWMSGFADTAAKFGMPIRLDQAYASDFVAAAAFPALVTGRVGGDGGGGWTHMAAAGPLLASLAVRPMMDVLITTNRATGLHQLVVAVLTTGPVGIGDEVGHTDVDMLRPALRNDSTILKPAHPAMRLDSWYSDRNAKGEVWEAVCGPAAAGKLLPPWSAGEDERANSMLSGLDGIAGGGIWRVLLATGTGDDESVGMPELFPAPKPADSFIVTEWGVPCANGSRAESNCSTMVSGDTRLKLTTRGPRAHGSGGRSFRLFNWAPVLPGGFALIGEQDKFVHVSPQRFTSGQAGQSRAEGSGDETFSARELICPDGSTMAFGVVGSPGELVRTTVLLPTQHGPTTAVLPVTVGAGGITHVACTSDGCECGSQPSGRAHLKSDDAIGGHPRLYFSSADIPRLRAKVREQPIMHALMQQFADALNNKLNYSTGGLMMNVCSSGGDECHQLAAALYLTGFGDNKTQTAAWGEWAKNRVQNLVTSIAKTPGGGFNGAWFAANERNIEQLVASYDVVADRFSAMEAAQMERSFASIANHLMVLCNPLNLSASTPGCFNAEDLGGRLHNSNADRLGAIGLIALTFPQQPNASHWLAHAVGEMEWMLANGVGEDGQWHEPSTRYHGRTLAAFIPLSYALRQAKKRDMFENPHLKRYAGWYRLVQTPPDATMGGCALTPGIADANWESVWEVTLGWAAGAYAVSDPAYSAELMAAWNRACSPMGLEPSPPNHLASLLWIDCSSNKCGAAAANVTSLAQPYPSETSQHREEPSSILGSYAVLRQKMGQTVDDEAYLLLSTSTQRQFDSHEHPDRGSMSLYGGGAPLVVDPGVGWSGYNWGRTVNGSCYGSWYRGSQSHSMVNFAANNGTKYNCSNDTEWLPVGASDEEFGLRGEANVDAHLFTPDLAFVDLNVTRAVQESQLAGVHGYHRRIFADWSSSRESYLIWDDVDAPEPLCAKATYNLHVVTDLGWTSKSGCAPKAGGDCAGGQGCTRVRCQVLNAQTMDVVVLRPRNAASQRLLKIEADPVPIQFTGTTGGAGKGSIGGAFAGDWNTPHNLPPSDAHWPPRQPTGIALRPGDAQQSGCSGFITLLQPNASTPVRRSLDLPHGAATVEVGPTLYLLGSRAKTAEAPEEMQGLAAVVGRNTTADGSLSHAALIDGTRLTVPGLMHLSSSSATKISVRRVAADQFVLKHHGHKAVTVEVSLPWDPDPPNPRWRTNPINIWRGTQHMWHVANATDNERLPPFEALPHEEYLLERQCRWLSAADGGGRHGQGGWTCDRAAAKLDDEARTDGGLDTKTRC